jgi:hypothetical protein
MSNKTNKTNKTINTVQEVSVQNLNQVQLIEMVPKNKKTVNLKPNQILVSQSLFDHDGKVRNLGTGFHFTILSFLYNYYIVNISDFEIDLINNEKQHGRFEYDLSVGGEVLVKPSIKFTVAQSDECLTELLRQYGTVKQAIQSKTETILGYELRKDTILDDDGHFDRKKYYNNIVNRKCDIKEIRDNAEETRLIDPKNNSIIEEADQLFKEYGIILDLVKVKDIDLPKSIRDMIEKEQKDETERRIKEANAKTDKKVAETNAERKRVEAISDAQSMMIRQLAGNHIVTDLLDKNNITPENRQQIFANKSLPNNTVYINNQNNGQDLMTQMIAASAASNMQRNDYIDYEEPTNNNVKQLKKRR